MKTNATFKSKLKESTDASYIVMDYLRSIGNDITDLTHDNDAQTRGMDFLVNGESVEFKTDLKTHITGNIAFEIVSNVGLGKIGGLLRSEAVWLLYYEIATGVCHKISLAALIDSLQKRGINQRWQTVIMNTPVGSDKFGYCTMSLLIPLSFIKNTLSKEAYKIFKVVNNGKPTGLLPDNSQ